jgi:hypothetical protein
MDQRRSDSDRVLRGRESNPAAIGSGSGISCLSKKCIRRSKKTFVVVPAAAARGSRGRITAARNARRHAMRPIVRAATPIAGPKPE